MFFNREACCYQDRLAATDSLLLRSSRQVHIRPTSNGCLTFGRPRRVLQCRGQMGPHIGTITSQFRMCCKIQLAASISNIRQWSPCRPDPENTEVSQLAFLCQIVTRHSNHWSGPINNAGNVHWFPGLPPHASVYLFHLEVASNSLVLVCFILPHIWA